ncbi:replication initiation protein RepM (plasmid) [Wohlfahrtiimonas chitiniclastica]|uniref:replication initiation protein RepM n=1 Tax=Wohlfahrtiimonas chitiniclastica TaxID=400946 RepID=UPI0007B410DD|nr:replication initiation protein RepM [Wohlfahrtiimonas chitiniclastica]WHR56391.1 replication initiation protein RepM [Wohlfahrtiimonas chitiniclastica]
MDNTPCTVVKDNVLINASYNLNLVEQRLILLAIVRSRETGKGITANDYLEIHASDYSDNFKTDRSSTYKSLRDNSKQLFKREFSFIRGNETILSRWVSTIKYCDETATVSLIFSPEVIVFISELEKHFTSYNLQSISGLTSSYAVRLYEIMSCWKYVQKTPIFGIEDFRQRLGVATHEYPRMSNFKTRVLDIAIKQVNTFTNLTVKCEQHKAGRNIIGFSFLISEKKVERDLNTIDCIDEKPNEKYITEDEFIALGSDGSDAYEIAIKAFNQGFKIPRNLQIKYGIEGDKFLKAKKSASQKAINTDKNKTTSDKATFILNDKTIGYLKKTITDSINKNKHLTNEVKQSFIIVEINEVYDAITTKQNIVDIDNKSVSEMNFKTKMYEAFNIQK